MVFKVLQLCWWRQYNWLSLVVCVFCSASKSLRTVYGFPYNAIMSIVIFISCLCSSYCLILIRLSHQLANVCMYVNMIGWLGWFTSHITIWFGTSRANIPLCVPVINHFILYYVMIILFGLVAVVYLFPLFRCSVALFVLFIRFHFNCTFFILNGYVILVFVTNSM